MYKIIARPNSSSSPASVRWRAAVSVVYAPCCACVFKLSWGQVKGRRGAMRLYKVGGGVSNAACAFVWGEINKVAPLSFKAHPEYAKSFAVIAGKH